MQRGTECAGLDRSQPVTRPRCQDLQGIASIDRSTPFASASLLERFLPLGRQTTEQNDPGGDLVRQLGDLEIGRRLFRRKSFKGKGELLVRKMVISKEGVRYQILFPFYVL